jgi:hypothetical protein
MDDSMPARFKPLLIDDEENVFDSIMVYPQSTGAMHVDGVYSKENKHPAYDVVVEAPDRNAVTHEEIILGDDAAYTVTVEISNRSDNEAFVQLRRAK